MVVGVNDEKLVAPSVPDSLASTPDGPHEGNSRDSAFDENQDELYDDEITGALHDTEAVTGRSSWLPAILILLAAFTLFFIGALAQKSSTRPPLVGPIEPAEHATGTLVVHVAGKVKKPGVYHLPYQARVNDAIAKAGGALPDADLNAINLAAWVEDGQRLEVPARAAAPQATPTPMLETLPHVKLAGEAPAAGAIAEVKPPPVARPTTRPKSPMAARKPPATGPAKDAVPRAVTASGEESTNASPEYLEKNPVDLNTATAEQLQILPGVGPAMAERILAYRKEKGRFGSVDELDEVRGIGEKTLEKLRPLVTVK